MSGSSGTGSGMNLVVAAEAAHARIKGMGAINFSHLPDVAEIVKRKFVEQFRDADLAQLLMTAGASGGFGWQFLEPVERDFTLTFKGGKLCRAVKAGAFLEQRELIVRRQEWFLLLQHRVETATESSNFHVAQMRQDHRDRPAIRR